MLDPREGRGGLKEPPRGRAASGGCGLEPGPAALLAVAETCGCFLEKGLEIH